MKTIPSTRRTKVNRLPKRASYDRKTIYKILDSSFVCNIGFNIEGQVYITPTAFGRKDDKVYFHGSNKSRMLQSIKEGKDICISVTLVDGIVLARSAFHHSINYRSVIIFGKPEEIKDADEKSRTLEIIMHQILPGRWDDVRKPSGKELDITSVFSLKINEASAKIRTGMPADDKEDLNLNMWSGIIPLNITAAKPVNNIDLKDNIPLPDYVKKYCSCMNENKLSI